MSSASHTKNLRPPHAFSCAAALAVLRTGLKAVGLRRTVRLARKLGTRREAVAQVPEELLRATTSRVATVAAFFPGRAECLEQSLAIYVLLRRRGVPVELRVGVHPFPFTAHAWVEHQGRPINERAEFVAQLAPFPTVGG